MATQSLVAESVQALAAQGAAFEAVLLVASALHKALRWSYLKTVVRDFAGIPQVLAPSALVAVAATEVAAASLLCLPGLRVFGASLAALVWAVYLGLVMRALARGRRDVDCGCSFGGTQRPLGTYQVARNSCLMGLSGFVAVTAHAAGNGFLGSQLLAACALLALYGALDQVMALRPLRAGAAP